MAAALTSPTPAMEGNTVRTALMRTFAQTVGFVFYALELVVFGMVLFVFLFMTQQLKLKIKSNLAKRFLLLHFDLLIILTFALIWLPHYLV